VDRVRSSPEKFPTFVLTCRICLKLQLVRVNFPKSLFKNLITGIRGDICEGGMQG
jgi:hypothetical protein